MSRVMMWCGRKSKSAPTGIDVPKGSPLAGFAERQFRCPVCGHFHACRNLYFEEDGPSAVDKHWFALDLVRDIAAEVGILVSMFAMIESCLPNYYRSLTGTHSGDATMTMGYFKSFGDKIELLELIIKNGPTHPEEAEQVAALIPRLRQANTLRNKYVHARYGIGVKDILHLEPFANDVRRKPHPEIKTLEEVAQDVRTMREIVDEATKVEFKATRP